jgi:hypothetical protein
MLALSQQAFALYVVLQIHCSGDTVISLILGIVKTNDEVYLDLVIMILIDRSST